MAAREGGPAAATERARSTAANELGTFVFATEQVVGTKHPVCERRGAREIVDERREVRRRKEAARVTVRQDRGVARRRERLLTRPGDEAERRLHA